MLLPHLATLTLFAQIYLSGMIWVMNIRYFVTILLGLSIITSCGGSSNGLNGSYRINDVNILADNIEVDEEVRVDIFFETKTESDGFPDGVDLVVRIPAELSYVLGTSQIYDSSLGDTDSYTPHRIEECPTGETFLVYNLSDGDLFEREIDGFGKFGLRFQARGKSPVSTTLLGASAGNGESFECGVTFEAEKSEAIEVLP